MRALLEAFARRRPAAARRAPEQRDGFEPAIDRLARLLRPLARSSGSCCCSRPRSSSTARSPRSSAALQAGTTRGRRSGSPSPRCPSAHWDALAPLSPLRRWRLRRARRRADARDARPLRSTSAILHYLAGIDGAGRASRRRRARGRRRRRARTVAASASPPSWRATVAAAGPRVLVRLDGDDVDARPRRRAGARRASSAATPLVVRARRAAARRPGARRRSRASSTARRCCSAACRSSTQEARDGAVVDRRSSTSSEAPLVVARRRVGRAAPGGACRCTARSGCRRPPRARALWSAALGEPVARALAQPRRGGRAALPPRRRRDRRGRARARRAPRADDADAATLRRLCRERARVGLEGLAERIEPAATLGRPRAARTAISTLLHEIVRHVRHRTQVYERWGFGERTVARPRRHRAVRRRERHRQDARRRGARGASSGSTSTASTSPRP